VHIDSKLARRFIPQATIVRDELCINRWVVEAPDEASPASFAICLRVSAEICKRAS